VRFNDVLGFRVGRRLSINKLVAVSRNLLGCVFNGNCKALIASCTMYLSRAMNVRKSRTSWLLEIFVGSEMTIAVVTSASKVPRFTSNFGFL
jgi:hypothetical protein